MTRQDIIRYIEEEAPGIGILENDTAAVVCLNVGCEETVDVDPDTLVVEGEGVEVESEEYDMEAGERTGRTFVEIYCSSECRNEHYTDPDLAGEL